MNEAATSTIPATLDRAKLRGLTLSSALEDAGLAEGYADKHVEHWPWEARRRLFAKLGYVPSPGQRDFHQSDARVKVLTAGARFGKSMSAIYEIIDLVLTPNTHGWVLGPTYDLAEKEWAYLEDLLGRLGMLQLATVHRRGKPAYLEFPWGAKVWMRSADNPTSLLGEELDWVVICEASQIEGRVVTRYVRARMGSRRGRIVVPTTPMGYNWVRDFFQRGMAQRRKREALPIGAEASPDDSGWEDSFDSFQFSVLENPTFDPAEYLAAAELLPREEFDEQYDGRFREMAGRVINTFSTGRHVVDDLPAELHSCPVFRTIDFGFSAPTAVLWCVFVRDGLVTGPKVPKHSWFVVAEAYVREMVTPDLAKLIKEHPWSVGHRVVFTIGDMADAQARATLGRYGVPCAEEVSRIHPDGEKTQPVQKAWDAGVRTLRTLFHQGRVMIHRSCANLIRELQTCVFAEGSDRPALDQDDHAMDALRYLLHTVTPA